MSVNATHNRLLEAVRQQADRQGVVLPEAIAAANGNLLSIAKSAGLDEAAVAEALAEATGFAYEPDLSLRVASTTFVERIPIAFARQHALIGLAGDESDTLPVAMADPSSWPQMDVVGRFLNRPVRPIIAKPSEIAAAINLAYQQQKGQAESFIGSLDRGQVLDEIQSLADRDDLLDVAGRAPVIKLVNLVLFEAVKQMASDVHIQPYEDQLVVRMRIDGVLFDAHTVPKALQEEVVSRLKVMGKMNIAEKRLAQDGRATVQVGDRVIDLRIASLPTSFGERVVIRLLDKSARLYHLTELGMDGPTLDRFRELIGVEHGLLLVTGPTGSGKSTTLYAALQELNSKEKNILTLEDPIEYQLPGISQTQVNERKGMTFERGLRHILRQDPDIVMIGEIRDRETAIMAIQSALTGHLVFATLHTNDAASAVTRLLDLGIEPYLAASSVIGVLAQRLVRCVCDGCGQSDPLNPDHLRQLELTANLARERSTKRGRGCEHCRHTGYRGRVGLFEMLTVNDAIQAQVQSRETASRIKQRAVESGMRTLRDDGVRKILNGQTTPDEVLRVTMRESH